MRGVCARGGRGSPHRARALPRRFESHLAVASFVLSILAFETLHLLPRAGLCPAIISNRLDGKPPTQPLNYFGKDWRKAVTPTVAYLGSARRDRAEITPRSREEHAEITRRARRDHAEITPCVCTSTHT